MKRIKLSKVLISVIIFSILLTSVLVSSLWIYYTYTEFKTDSAVAEKIYIKNKKEILKQRISSIISYIDEQRKGWMENQKEQVENKVFIGYLTAYHIYNKYKNKKPIKDIKKDVINFFKSIESCDEGCFFIYDIKHNKVYKNKKKNIPDILLKKLKTKNKLELMFLINENNKKIIAYAKYFEPFNWYIGYIDTFNRKENALQKKIINYLSNYRFDRNRHGYIFVSKLINPHGGQCFAKVLVNPNIPDLVGKCVSDNVTDLHGRYFRREYLNSLRRKGYALLEYTYKIPGSNKYGEKLSYMVLYKPWNWIIGTGYYIKDLKASLFQIKMDAFEKNLYKKVTIIVAISVVILFLLLLVYLLVYDILRRDMKHIKSFFAQYPGDSRIDLKKIRIDDVYRVAKRINEMADKIDIYSKHLRESLEKYHGLMSYMPDCVVISKNKDGKMVIDEINECMESFFNKKRLEIIGCEVDEIFRDMPGLVQRIYDVFKTKITVESVDCVKKASKNSKERYCSCVVYGLEDDTVVAILKDVTDKVMLFKQIERRQKQVEKFINTINAGIIVSNERGNIFYINDMAKEILELSDKPSRKEILKVIGSENIMGLRNRMIFLNKKRSGNKCQNCNIKIKTKNGHEKWLDLSIGSIEFDDKQMFVASFYDVTKRYLKEKEIEYISFHDSLTGLYNRRYFEEELSRLFKARNYPLSLVMYDLNGLKIVNDVLGHKSGDDLIKNFGDILQSSSRASDVASRIGGDEFAVIMPNTDENGVSVFVKRVEEKIDALNENKDAVFLSVSYGYSTQNGEINTIEELFSAADSAMYQNKYRQRNVVLKKIIESIQFIKNSR